MCASSRTGGTPRARRCASCSTARSRRPQSPRPRPSATTEAALASPPVAPRHPSRRTLHGVVLTDDYAWLKDKNWQEVLRDPSRLDPDIRSYLEAENRYTDAILGPTDALQKTLVAEMRGRI